MIRRLLALVAVAAPQVLLAAVVALFVATAENSLRCHPEWIPTKATLGMPVMGARHYASTRETLKDEHLDLGRWHGYQEVLHDAPLDLREVSFRARLEPGAYVIFVFDRTDAGFAGLRLSTHPRLRSGFFRADPAGRFETSRPVQLRGVEPDEWIDVHAAFADGRVAVDVGSESAGSFPVRAPSSQRFGFRGSERAALIDDVVVTHGDPSATFTETFFARTTFLRVFLAVLFPLGVASLLVFRQARRSPTNRLLFAAMTALLVLLVATTAALVGFRARLMDIYPEVDPAAELAFRVEETDAVRRTATERFDAAGRDAIRILFLGGSQTVGAGASRPDDAFVPRLERLLAAKEGGRPVACVNAAVSGVGSDVVLELYEKRWLVRAPDLVVLNVSVNDDDPGPLAANVERLLAANAARGIRTIVALEANSIEIAERKVNHHARLRSVADAFDVPVADPHSHLRSKANSGLLWWDFCHPTSYGHALIAEALLPSIQAELARIEG